MSKDEALRHVPETHFGNTKDEPVAWTDENFMSIYVSEDIAKDCGATVKLYTSPQQQEPFGYFRAEPFGWTDCAETDEGAIALYEFSPQRTWVGLTEQERNDLEDYCEMVVGKAAFDVIEAKLREKNT